jgi:quaternary ammonium compound-resistance protein SugE
MPWLILILSGALEAVWAAALHRAFQASGRRRIGPAALFLVSVAASTGGLAIAMQSIPTGTAYAVWVGVGVVLTSAYAIAPGWNVRRRHASSCCPASPCAWLA